MAGTLYLCPTPIGNLKDITQRTLETLQSVDFILAEDTRNSGLLLSRYQIRKPLVSYHKYNEQERSPEVIKRLQDGQSAALVTDAGMPGISDPGQILAAKCHQAGVPVTCLPGPSAFVTALAMSGLSSRRFAFEGFLPVDKQEKEQVLDRLSASPYTTIFYEAPHRLKETLRTLAKYAPDRKSACIRELTKIYEECRLGTLEELAEYFSLNEPRGEFVIIIEGLTPQQLDRQQKNRFEGMSLQEHMELYKDLPEKEAMKRVARDMGLSKRDIYQQLKTGNQP